MAHYEPPHQDLRCLQIQLFSSLVVKELTRKVPRTNTAILANRIDPDEAAHNELPHLGLHYLPSLQSLNSQYDTACTKPFFVNFADVKFVICCFWAVSFKQFPVRITFMMAILDNIYVNCS